jgi:hypothetical protein
MQLIIPALGVYVPEAVNTCLLTVTTDVEIAAHDGSAPTPFVLKKLPEVPAPSRVHVEAPR